MPFRPNRVGRVSLGSGWGPWVVSGLGSLLGSVLRAVYGSLAVVWWSPGVAKVEAHGRQVGTRHFWREREFVLLHPPNAISRFPLCYQAPEGLACAFAREFRDLSPRARASRRPASTAVALPGGHILLGAQLPCLPPS